LPPVFELQIAQVFVDGGFAFVQMREGSSGSGGASLGSDNRMNAMMATAARKQLE